MAESTITTTGKSALQSKTVVFNSSLLALYTIAQWVWPQFTIPEEVLVAGTTLINLILRLTTKQPIGG